MPENVGQGFWEGLEARYRPFRGPNPVGARVATRIGIYAALGAAINIAIIGVFELAYDETLAALIGFGFAVIYLSATVYFVATGDSETQLKIILASSAVGNIVGHIILGGYLGSGGFLFFGVLVSALSALLLGKRWTIGITGTYVLAAIVLALFDATIRSWREPPDPVLSIVIAADVFVSSLLILAPMAFLLTERLAYEQQRSDSLLLNVFPASIARRLKDRPDVIADEFDSCSVLFADLVGFTNHAGIVSPERLVEELNLIFSRFDELVEETGTEKIKTIGDGYLAVAGAPTANPNHVQAICDLALAMQDEMHSINTHLDTEFQLRVGVHTGRVVAGVIGNSRFSYDIWGDTVNVASRLQTEGLPGCIVISEAVAVALGGLYQYHSIGLLELKGKGEVNAFELERRIKG